MSDDPNALELFDKANKAARVSNYSTKEEIEIYGRAAMRAIIAALKENDMLAAIDTLEKTMAIENYLIFQIGHERAKLADINMLITTRFEILKIIGRWLDEHLAEPGDPPRGDKGTFEHHGNTSVTMVPQPDGSTKFYLEDLGITKRQSADWQKLAKMPQEQYDDFVKPFLQVDEQDKENLLSFGKIKAIMYPKPIPEEPEIPFPKPDFPMSSMGWKVYNTMHALETNALEWNGTIGDHEQVSMRELTFLGRLMVDHYHFIGGIMNAVATELKEGRGVPV